MTMMRKMMTLLRGQVRQGTELVLDANALALLDQQLFETEQGLIAARRDLSRLMAERLLQEKQQQQTQAAIDKYERCARDALARDEQQLLNDTAARIAELEQRRDRQSGLIAELGEREREFQQFIRDTGEALRELRQQQAQARVADRLQRTSSSIGGQGRSLAGKLEDSRDTLQRLQQRQQRAQLEWQAQCSLDAEQQGSSLDQRLQAAGILASRQSRQQEIIQRLRGEAVPKSDQPPMM